MNFLMDQIFNRPLLLEQTRAQMIFDVIAPRFGMDPKDLQHFEKNTALFGEFRTEPNSISLVEGRVAVVPVLGSLVQRRMNVNPVSGALLSYQEIAANLLTAAEDDRVEAILIDISSGGGQADSAFDLARTIREIDQTMKPVFAIANSAAFSAAYAIAAGARKIFVSETGGVGSVGVFAEHVDFSKQNEMKGIEVTLIKSGDLKAERSPDFPLSKEAEARLQNEVDKVYNLFVGLIAEMRGLSLKEVINTQAGLFFGQEAVDAGLADEVANFDEAIESILQSESNEVTIKQTDMNEDNRAMKIFSKKEEEVLKAEEKLEAPTVLNDDAEEEAPAEDAPKADAEEEAPAEDAPETDAEDAPEAPSVDAAEIVDLAVKAGCPDQAAQMIRAGLTVEQATNQLQSNERIKELCSKAVDMGLKDFSGEFISAELTVTEVQSKLLDKLHARSSKTDISSKTSAASIEQDKVLEYAEGSDDNALVAGAKKMKAKADKANKAKGA